VQPVEVMPWWRSINTGNGVSPITGDVNWTEIEDAEKVIAEDVRKNGASNNPKTAQIK
jgi:hypothetical protein